MKILLFINQLGGGGAERIATIMLNHFCEKHDSYVAITNFEIPFYPLNNKVKIIDDRIKVKFKGASRIPRFLKMILTIKKIKPDLIISFMTKNNINALTANLILRRKIIVTEHNTLKRLQSKHYQLLRKILYPTADKIIFVSNEDCQNFGYVSKSLTIYNPLMLPPYNDYNKRENTIITIAPTDRWYNKGLDLLISAWNQIAVTNINWHLEILGEKDDNDLPKGINIQAKEKTILLGWQNNVKDILQTKSIFILASRYEGCPVSLIEAMSQGCACIVTNCDGGMKEMITDGVDGLIAQSGDIKDIADKLQLLINDDNLRHKLSAGAVEKSKQFDKNIFFSKWDNLLEEIAKK